MTIQHGSRHESRHLPLRTVLEPKDANKRLQIGIIGAGIGGLMAAIALLESGHDVEIFEKSRFKSEVGAAICAPPNSSRVLAYYGFDFERARATNAQDFIYYNDAANLDNKRVVPCTNFTPKYGAPWYFFHRVDLHSELKRMATEPTATRPQTARLHLNTSVHDVGQNGTIGFEDGTSVQKDVVIAADGIRSSFLSTVVDNAAPAKHHMSILRYMIPVDDLEADPEVTAFFKDGLASIRVVNGTDKLAVIYGCRGGSLQNIGLLYSPQSAMDVDVNHVSAGEDFDNEVIAGFPKTVQSVCRQAKGVGQWKLFTRKPLERLARGRVVVIGDAAHPMPPLRAQGAAMAIEDAAALGVLLSAVKSKDEIATRLSLFNELRLKRVAATQIMSSEHRWDPSRLSGEQRQYFDGEVPKTEDDLDRYSFEHDVIREAFSLLQEHRQ